MIKIVTSGDYVQVKYVDTISEYVQEELKADSDAIEYSRDSNGKIYLKFGRMTFEYADPTEFEIDGDAVTDAADFITKLTALFSIPSPGGGGVQLEEYTNSAMSAAVQAYVFRDEDDNIFRVYEPIRNNDISRKTFAYADSIDLFAFDSADNLDNNLIDVKLVDSDNGIIFNNCRLQSIVIDVGGFSDLALTGVSWVSNGGVDGIELEVLGDSVQLVGCSIGYRTKIHGIGASCIITRATIGAGADIDFNSSTGQSITDCTFSDFMNIYYDDTFSGGSITDVQLGNAAYLEMNAAVSIGFCQLDASAQLYAGHNCTRLWIGLDAAYTTPADASDKRIIKIDGTTKEINAIVQSVTGDLVDNTDTENPVVDLPGNVTTQGNDFNGASQLVKLDAGGLLSRLEALLTNDALINGDGDKKIVFSNFDVFGIGRSDASLNDFTEYFQIFDRTSQILLQFNTEAGEQQAQFASYGAAGASYFVMSTNADAGYYFQLNSTDGVNMVQVKLNAVTGIVEVDNDVEITTIGKGLILKSPDGTRYRIKVANGGALSTEAV